MCSRGVFLAAVVLALSTASAKVYITPYKPTHGAWGPVAAPNCYTAKQVYTGNATCFGATYVGGMIGTGTLTQINENGTNFTTLYSFDVVQGLMPSQSPILMPDGYTLVGTTSQGGSSGSGLVFAYNLKNNTIATLGAFTGPGGSTPQAPPIQVNGILYGIAGQGGLYGYGVVWSLKPGSGVITVLHHFAGGLNDTATPFGALTYNPLDGLLYGMGFTAGKNGLGGIFSLALNGSGYTLRASLNPQTGGAPQMGALLLSMDGNLYANTWLSAAYGLGAIVRFNPKTSALTTVFSYNLTSGSQPYCSLSESPSGRWLYSVTWKGGKNGVGTVLAVAKNGTTSKVLLQLNWPTTGGTGFASPTVSLDGKRIITQMPGGGKFGVGTLLSIDIPSQVI